MVDTSAAAASGWEPIKPIPVADAGEDHAVILLDETLVRMKADPNGRPAIDVIQHRRVQLLRPEAGALARVTVPYRPGFSNLVAFEGRTVDPDGRERTFGLRDTLDMQSLPGALLYSDARARVMALQPTARGTILEYRWRQRVTDWRFFQFGKSFASEYPAREIRFEVAAPPGWEIEHLAQELDRKIEFPPTVSTSSGETRWTWQRHDVPALRAEPLAPSIDEMAPQVLARLRAYVDHGAREEAPADPTQLSAWLHGWTKPPPSHEAAALAKRLVDGVPRDPELQARRLYAWVRDEIAYYAIEVGMGAFRPHGADEVLRGRYGDCKDKANLLHDLLAAVGVPSRRVVLYAHDGLPHQLGLPTVSNNFNHVILEVSLPSAPVLVDPTSPTAAFGELPSGDQDAEVLPIDEHGAPLARAPSGSPKDNDSTIRLELSSDGEDLVGRLEAKVNGSAAAHLRAGLRQSADADRPGRVARLLGVHSAQMKTPMVRDERPAEVPTPVEVVAEVRFAHVAGSRFLLRLTDLLDPLVESLPFGRRTSPVLLQDRRRYEQQVRLRLGSLDVRSTPAPVHIEERFAKYELTWAREEGALVLTRRLELREPIIAPAQYPEFRSFVERVLAAEARAVSVHKTGDDR